MSLRERLGRARICAALLAASIVVAVACGGGSGAAPVCLTGSERCPCYGNATCNIVAGPDGNLWFTEGGGNKIGRITP